ncbi:uncharacterized protein Tco025E_06229 [Trypanosoma conorhini]|uniref:SAYSvFN domain-containing protein n=1 Tax=Trypanosoma conorhini TaxID=83891 RepID=A0A3R7N5V8_9TRYP|nr:uncharacterized protein Tco025E_06229 [Trypanosoma conorhini]RNF13300.1 hypothetical protein Tco025E_06229 [Trypanosoma conorhini]
MSAHAGPSLGASGEEEKDPRRILSWEEYRAEYVRQQRLRYQLQRESNANTENDAEAFSPTAAAAAAAAASPQERWEQGQARRQNLAQQQQPQPQPQPAEAGIDIWARIELRPGDVITVVRVLGRVFLATFLVFRTFSVYYFFLTLLIYMGWRAGQRALGAIRIERENRDAAGNLFRGTAHPEAQRRHHHRRQRVSLPRKAVYIFTRCITSFLLSLSPTYSVEQLESELQEDGIVGPHLHQD